MVACDVTMVLFPEFLDVVHPGLIARLEKDVELRVMFQPGLRQVGFVDDVVIGNEGPIAKPGLSLRGRTDRKNAKDTRVIRAYDDSN